MGAGQSGGFEVGGSSMGYQEWSRRLQFDQVLRVYPDSPGSRAGLKAYFDFIVAIGNTRFNKENGSLKEILKASVDQKLKMIVYNTRTKSTREVEIVPTTSWGGNGLLGVSIKHSSFDRADERVWHVVEVEPRSPAEQAGFKANEDYVIGSDSILQENDDLYNLVEAHEGKSLKLFVYNVNTDNCREVICHPNSRWGGKGYLGCEFGHGLLHRIPYADKSRNISDNPTASLLRNEQPPATQQNYNSYNSPMMQNQLQALQKTAHPGQQLFQQALFNQTSPVTQQPQKPAFQYQQYNQNIFSNQPIQPQPQPQQQLQPQPNQAQPPPPPPPTSQQHVQQLQPAPHQQQQALSQPPPPPQQQLPPPQQQLPPPPLPPPQQPLQQQPPPPPPQQPPPQQSPPQQSPQQQQPPPQQPQQQQQQQQMQHQLQQQQQQQQQPQHQPQESQYHLHQYHQQLQQDYLRMQQQQFQPRQPPMQQQLPPPPPPPQQPSPTQQPPQAVQAPAQAQSPSPPPLPQVQTFAQLAEVPYQGLGDFH